MPVFSRFFHYFVAVARCGSIRKASEELHVAASAINRQILQGEAVLGVPLFERVQAGMRLTAAGEALLFRARNWSDELEETRAHLEDLRGLRRGQVTVAAIEALTRSTMPDVIRRLRAQHPLITVRLLVMDNAEIEAAIIAGTVDFGVLLDPRARRDLEIRARIEVPLGFVSTPDHPIASRATARLSDGLDYPLVAALEPLAISRWHRELEAGTGIVLRPGCSSNNLQMIKSLIRAGAGIGLLSAVDAAEEIRRGELAFTAIATPSRRSLALALVIQRARQVSAAARLVIGAMESALADLPAAWRPDGAAASAFAGSFEAAAD